MKNNTAKQYRVVRMDNGPRNPHTSVVSEYNSLEAAETAITKSNARLRRQAGYANARRPYAIQKSVTVTYTDGTTGTAWERA